MRSIIFALVATLATGFVSCADDSNDSWPSNLDSAIDTYVDVVQASYADSVSTAVTLNTALKNLVGSPSQANLEVARQAWLDSREPYLQTEVYRFYDGPIDNPVDGPEGSLNAWPLDENYIDYVDGDPSAGIVNGTEPLDGDSLDSLNGVGGESNVSTGYHAIEFLLWGQDLNDEGPGERPYTDYVVSASGAFGCYSGPPSHQCTCGGTEADCAAPAMWTDQCGCPGNADRRGQYLLAVGDLLVAQLTHVHDAWVDGSDYYTSFTADSEAAFEKILTGMIVLSGFETGSERLQAALDSGDREDEHSCFSDNTHRDMIQDIQGIKNVWDGSYGAVNGVGIHDVVAARDADLAAALDARIIESLQLANQLQVPFENEIAPGNTEGRARVQALVESLMLQEQLLFDVFTLFGLTIEIPE